jgi:hypothetical protein
MPHIIRVPDRYRLADGAIDTAAIKAHVNIVEVVKLATTKMTGSGDARMAVCPMHEDHRPSLSVTPSLGLFYCHACRVGGDVIDFVRMVSNVPFVDACEWLIGANTTCTPTVRDGTLGAGAKRMRNREQASAEWRDATPITGTVVDAISRPEASVETCQARYALASCHAGMIMTRGPKARASLP